jgi:hypothetical protein
MESGLLLVKEREMAISTPNSLREDTRPKPKLLPHSESTYKMPRRRQPNSRTMFAIARQLVVMLGTVRRKCG